MRWIRERDIEDILHLAEVACDVYEAGEAWFGLIRGILDGCERIMIVPQVEAPE